MAAVPTGRVKWYDTEKGFGFLTRDDGGDVFVHKAEIMPDLRRGRFPDRKATKKIAEVVHGVARELEV